MKRIGSIGLIIGSCLSLAYAHHHRTICPQHIQFDCVPAAAGSALPTLCTLINDRLDNSWVFAAPDHVVQATAAQTLHPFVNAHAVGHSSPSILPPGVYQVKYSMTYVGTITNLPGTDNAYCAYFGEQGVANVYMAGLYSTQHTVAWQKTPTGMMCQNSQDCELIKRS